jgi:hypothetical protein
VVTITRTVRNADGVFGVLRMPGFVCVTAEEQDLGNARSVSCIPAGTYPLRRTTYLKHGFPTYEVADVPGRSRILIHPGNTEEDSQGCILLGLRAGKLRVRDEDSGQMETKHAVLSSQAAFGRFMQAMAGVKESQLTIVETY